MQQLDLQPIGIGQSSWLFSFWSASYVGRAALKLWSIRPICSIDMPGSAGDCDIDGPGRPAYGRGGLRREDAPAPFVSCKVINMLLVGLGWLQAPVCFLFIR